MQRSSDMGVVGQRLSKIESNCANIVLAGGTIVTALIFAYYFYYYVWTGTRQFVNWRGAVFYMIAPGALSCFFLTSLGLSRSCKIKVALVCLTVNTALLLSERVLQTKTSSVEAPFWGVDQASLKRKRIIAELGQKSGIHFDTRDRVEISDELRQRGIDAVPAVMIASLLDEKSSRRFKNYTSAAQIVPIGAIAKKTTVLCNESGRYVTYESDEHGFR